MNPFNLKFYCEKLRQLCSEISLIFYIFSIVTTMEYIFNITT